LSFEKGSFIHAFAQTSTAEDSSADVNTSQSASSLRATTALGNYEVEMSWEPKSLGIDRDTTFSVKFFDKTGKPISSQVNYDFTIAGSDLSPIIEYNNQTTDQNGVGLPPPVRFEKPEPVEVTIWVNPAGLGDNVQSESATFDIVVTPEFPVSILAIYTGVMLGSILLISKFRLHY